MPVKLRKGKERKSTITDEMIEAFLTVRRLKEKRLACIHGENCDAPVNTRCSDCAACSEASVFLHRSLGRKLWEWHVEDVTPGEPPDWQDNDRLKFTDWHTAVEQQLELLAAIKGRRSRS